VLQPLGAGASSGLARSCLHHKLQGFQNLSGVPLVYPKMSIEPSRVTS